MENNLNKQIEIQNKISMIVKERQIQISELKCYFDSKNKTMYKDIILLSENLNLFENFFNKSEYRSRVENLHSLSISIGKIIDLNNSIKTILLGIKIFEEHEMYLKQRTPNNANSKGFLYKMFEKNQSTPLIKDESIKNKFNLKSHSNDNYNIMRDFYQSLFRADDNFWTDFNNYLNFQMDPKQKIKENQFKFEDFTTKLLKLYNCSNVNYYKFYVRSQSLFDIDYPSLVVTACDIFFMLYNKFIDKICYHENLLDYIVKLDDYIYKHFIEILSDDLQKLSEYIAKKEMDELLKNLDKIYN